MRSHLTTALCVSSVCLVVAAPALGDTFRPTRTDDPAPAGACAPRDCSLREAIVAANQNPGRDEVILAGGRTYRLSIPANLDDFDVDGDLNLTESVKLVSSNRRLATIDGQGIDDVIHSG